MSHEDNRHPFDRVFSAPRSLVVEDDRAWQQILVELLGDAGLAVDVAEDVPSTLACIRSTPHRIAIIDLSLGGTDHGNRDGLEVLDAVRRHDPGCTALLLTGYATVEIAVSALTEHGAYTCLRKETFRRAQFRDLIRQVLAEAPAFQGETTNESILSAGDESMPAPGEGSGTHSDEGGYPQHSGDEGSRAATEERETHQARGQALVVEDDAGWGSILIELLRESGYRAHTCRSYGEALGYLRRETYALAVIDLCLANSLAPDKNSDGLQVLIATKKAGTPSIVVSGAALSQEVEQAYEQHGIVAFLEKQSFDRRAFRRAVHYAAEVSPASAWELLTAREQEVLALLSQGLTNKEIAEALFISDNTVKRHLKAIFAKLEVNTRAAAAAKAVGAGPPNRNRK